jgi:alkanesulfonate monooxygenase SsuD/methylene tetrahydromethanopterin reductase-like flavin-dependent oxidoreductase (luciferase family)
MEFGLILVPSTLSGQPERYSELMEQVQAADDLGYDYVWFTEHHFGEYGRPSPLLQAAHAAALTKRIKIGISVVVLPFHNPLEVAEDVATLDHLSGGRVAFGIGRGQQPHEFAGYDVPLDESRQRFEEAYRIITGLWTNDTFAHKGQFWNVPEVRLLPKPLQTPHPPIWQPAVSSETIRKIIEKGINGLVGSYLVPFPQLKERYFDPWNLLVAELGRPGLQMGHNEIVYVADTNEQAYADAKDAVIWYARKASQVWGARDSGTGQVIDQYAYIAPVLNFLQRVSFDEIFNDLSLIGSPERVTERLRFFENCGVNQLLLFNWIGPLSHARTLRSLELFARHVMPAFKKSPTLVA